MKRQQEPRGKTRNRRMLVLISFLVIICGIIMIFNLNNHTPSIDGKATSKPPIPAESSQANEPNKNIYKIVIDAGHGGHDPGANGVSGKEEKVFTLSLSQKIYDLLKQDPMFEPHMTRTDDTFVDLLVRSKFANDLNADALISIHGNFFKDPQVKGTETYYSFDNGLQLAQIVHENFVKGTGFQDRGVKRQKLKVLSHSNMPAILMEIGYLTNKDEETAMLSSKGQNRAAQAIVDGLKQYFIQRK
jgi:N-acetylmuramoyl-L-alanine amidase